MLCDKYPYAACAETCRILGLVTNCVLFVHLRADVHGVGNMKMG